MNLLDPILTLFFPQSCGVCGSPVETANDGAACGNCWESTPLFSSFHTFCAKCGKPHARSNKPVTTFCRQCDDDHYDAARSVGPYKGAFAATVLHLKNTPSFSERAAKLMFDTYVDAPFGGIELIVPVPLSKRRRFERGFNQAELIARALAKKASLQCDLKSLRRETHAEISRASMDRKGRAMTVRNAFAANRSNLLANKTVLVVDDVFTSGASVSMAAKALKKGGAAKVFVLTLARAGKISGLETPPMDYRTSEPEGPY